MSKSKSAAFVAGALVLSFVATPTAAGGLDRSMVVKAQYGETVYRYCYISKAPYGDVVYFSESFGVSGDAYHVGIQNAFNSYVSGRHDSDVISGANCMGPYATHQEAADALNDHMGERRRAGKSVVMTWWRYRGD